MYILCMYNVMHNVITVHRARPYTISNIGCS